MAACGVFALTGCGGDKAASSSAASSAAGQGALLQKIKKDGKLVVGTAPGFPPYEFLDTSVKDKKSITGIDIKIAEAVAKKLGVKLEVQDMTFQSLLASITTGKIDIAISAITRLQNVRRPSISPTATSSASIPSLSVRKIQASTRRWLISMAKDRRPEVFFAGKADQ